MNRTRKLLKKVIAVAAASSLIAAGGSTVMAAGSYQEAETAAYDKFVSGVASSWEEYLASYQTSQYCAGRTGSFCHRFPAGRPEYFCCHIPDFFCNSFSVVYF